MAGKRKGEVASDGPRAELAHRLREARDTAGVTLRELAQRAGYSAAALSAAESGRKAPTWDVTASFVKALGQDPLHWRSLWEAASRDGNRAGDDPDRSPAAAAAPIPPAEHPRRRRATLVATAVLSALLAAATTGLAVSHRDDTAERHPSARHGTAESALWRSLPEARSAPGRPADATDPIQTGCGSPDVVARVITFDEVPVRLPGGMDFGRLLLRHQPGCRTSWGLVKGPHNAQRRVHISVRRPADHVVVTSSFAGESVDSYGQQLSTVEGCVYVEAFVETPEGRGPLARTRCA
ncbi:helix-turn-helix domain-containing protein [Streptomyces kebangsaanensis]|uniref:helix-turn-helix domain-containing protein n=1 Tax=Streptomyces kebangsaanensis TaxID=864058 RepID=UPI00093B9802|nr:helix-turn-helix domain-containing protein [Streptomyces kebangsaanensis]